MADDKLLGKIAGLLNKAEHTDNEHERDAFFAAAQRMAVNAELTLEEARRHTKGKQQAPSLPTMKHIVIGEKGDRGGGGYTLLFRAVAEVNDIYVVSADSGAWVEAYGMSRDIEVAEALYTVIVAQMVQACTEYITTNEWRDGRSNIWDARRSFYAAYTARIRQRLVEARRDAEAEFEASSGTSASLVLADKRREVAGLYYERAGSMKRYRAPSGTNRSARNAGTAAANDARLRRRDEVAGRKQLG